jgi:BirA family biotin operon repressor/biotin-[acetyl-CoA-carboxylase] ligase
MAYQLALVTGVAVFDALQSVIRPVPAGLRLKWPNDILIDDAKTGGILIESNVTGDLLVAVIGIGLNIATSPAIADRATTHLAAHGAAPEPHVVLELIADRMRTWLGTWDQGRGFAAVREAWLNRALPIGERLSINTGSDRVLGTFAGLDPEGALLLESGGGVRRFTFGDVSLAR